MFLPQAGADPLMRDRFGRTPIICAARGITNSAPIIMRDIFDHVPQAQWKAVANMTDYFGMNRVYHILGSSNTRDSTN
jgi:hypothetical protein